MKKLFVFFFFIIFSFSIYSDSFDDSFLVRKYQGIAIGQLTLAHRLISLATSLSISRAVESDYILSLLENIDATINNTKSIIKANGRNPEGRNSQKLTQEILKSIDFFVSCSDSVKRYTVEPNYDNLSSIRQCVERSSNIINNLTDSYNKGNKKEIVPEKTEKKGTPEKITDKNKN